MLGLFEFPVFHVSCFLGPGRDNRLNPSHVLIRKPITDPRMQVGRSWEERVTTHGVTPACLLYLPCPLRLAIDGALMVHFLGIGHARAPSATALVGQSLVKRTRRRHQYEKVPRFKN
jgi:hypothetical protein